MNVPVIEYLSPAPDISWIAFAAVIEFSALALVVTYTTLAHVTEHASPATAVICEAFTQQSGVERSKMKRVPFHDIQEHVEVPMLLVDISVAPARRTNQWKRVRRRRLSQVVDLCVPQNFVRTEHSSSTAKARTTFKRLLQKVLTLAAKREIGTSQSRTGWTRTRCIAKVSVSKEVFKGLRILESFCHRSDQNRLRRINAHRQQEKFVGGAGRSQKQANRDAPQPN